MTSFDVLTRNQHTEQNNFEVVEILRDDFILLRLFAVCGMTFCFAMFFLQIGTSLRSYELLQQYIEERESQYSFLDFYESNEYWSWDPDLFLLTVNTTFYAH
ncbi:uncharacterized protein [Mytilus edulis]|uniref:uncharacterized protein isoform X2 n=1 Tax=Mytilus edulis TaxID=6550 RepID=UPI0039F08C70